MRLVKFFFVCFCLFFPFLGYADIFVATVMPKSGPYRVWGDELAEGAKIAVDEINREGGLRKQKIVLLNIDDACSENLALSTAQMLSVKKENKPALVIGPYCSEGLDQIAKTYADGQIFQIVPAFLNKNQASDKHSGLIKLFGNVEYAASDFFDFYNKFFAGQNVAVVSTKDSQALDQNVVETFQKHGKSSLVHLYQLDDFKTLDLLALKLYEQKEDVVFMFGNPKHAGKIIKKLKHLKADAVFVVSRYIANDDFFENAQSFLDTTYFMALPEFDDTPKMAESIVQLRLFNVELNGLNVYGYTAVKMWAELVDKNKTFDYRKLSTYIKKYGFKTSWGETFYNNGNIKKPPNYLFYKYVDGDFVLN